MDGKFRDPFNPIYKLKYMYKIEGAGESLRRCKEDAVGRGHDILLLCPDPCGERVRALESMAASKGALAKWDVSSSLEGDDAAKFQLLT
jgi:hypothetical protein